MSKTLAEKIAVMQAAERGEQIQIGQDGNWADVCIPIWSWDRYDFRVKPQPKVIWVNEYDDVTSAGHSSESAARRHAEPSAKRVAVKYVEAQD